MAYSAQEIREFLTQQGLVGPNGSAIDPAGIYAAARQYGVAPAELDTAMGWNPGDAQNWINQQGLATTDTGTTTPGTVSLANAVNPVQARSAAGVAPLHAAQASNPYIGQTTQQTSASQYMGQTTPGASMSNPYMGQTGGSVSAQNAGVERNALAGVDNPYLTRAIDAASQDAARNYNLTVAPQRQTQMQQSGAFGNTGVQQMQLEDQRNLQNTLGNIATQARYGDYAQQLGLAENAAARGTQANQFNAAQNLGAQQFNVGARQADLARNLGAANQIGMFNAGLAQNDLARNLGADMQRQQFNAGLSQADLARNSNAAMGLGTFNAGQANQLGMFGAGQQQQNNQFNAGQANNLGQFNAGQQQQRNMYNAGAQNQGNQFNENLDFNIYNSNANAANIANTNQFNFLNSLLGLQGQGAGLAGNMYMQPMNLYGQFANQAMGFGGMGGTNTQPTSGNPVLGALGGMKLAGSLFGD
jgi:hypothetical protein